MVEQHSHDEVAAELSKTSLVQFWWFVQTKTRTQPGITQVYALQTLHPHISCRAPRSSSLQWPQCQASRTRGRKGSSTSRSHTTTSPRCPACPGSAVGCQVTPGGQGGTSRARCPLPEPRRRQAGRDASSAGEPGETPRLLPAEPLPYRTPEPGTAPLNLCYLLLNSLGYTLQERNQGCTLHYSLSLEACGAGRGWREEIGSLGTCVKTSLPRKFRFST